MTVTDGPERSEAGNGRAGTTPNLVALQCVASVAGTLIGESLGSDLASKLIAGLLGAVLGAFLTAPGKHHRRRIVAVALLLALLEALRRTPDALASGGRQRRGPAWEPASWAAVGLTAVAGFAIGSGITTIRGGWPDGEEQVSPPALVFVPDVAGEPRDAARAALEDAGLSPRDANEPSAEFDEGLVTRTDPPAGARVDRAATITLFVSSGPPPPGTTIVPDVAGLPEADAVARLEGTGLEGETAFEPSAEFDEGVVTRTDPTAGTEVEPGTIVRVFVSSGSPPTEPTVPNVVGLAEVQALAELEAAGLNADTAPEPSAEFDEGLVTRTDPTAGTEVEPGTIVMVFVSSGPPSDIE